MFWMGIIILLLGLLGAGFKGYAVWTAAHDIHNGGGAPTLDFTVFWPIPIAVGGSVALTGANHYPFAGFGFVLYGALLIGFGFLPWMFYRHGAPERERQLRLIQEQKKR